MNFPLLDVAHDGIRDEERPEEDTTNLNTNARVNNLGGHHLKHVDSIRVVDFVLKSLIFPEKAS